MGEPRLYKYLDSKGGLAMLYNQTLMFTHPTRMNDPFDCHPDLIDFSNVPQEKRKIWGPEIIKFLESESYRQYRERSWLCCLSKVYDSLQMWAHYANNSTGVCIGLNMNNARKYLSRMMGLIIGCLEWEVEYKDIEEKPDYFRRTIDLFHYQIATKAKEWEYEKEVRLISYNPSPLYMGLLEGQKSTRKHPLEEHDIHRFLKIGGECFESLFFGININKTAKHQLIEVARKVNNNIKIYQMTMDSGTLRLTYE